MTLAPQRTPTEDLAPPRRPTRWPLLALLLGVLVALIATLAWLATRDGTDGLAVGGVDRIGGSGTVVSVSRSVSDFDALTLMSSGRFIITQGSEASLTIETDDNLLPYIQTEVRDNTLEVSAERDGNSVNLDPTDEILFRVGIVDLSELNVFGAGSFEMDELDAVRLDLSVSGSADVEIGQLAAGTLAIEVAGRADLALAGTADDAEIRFLGSGTYRGAELRIAAAEVAILGTGSVEIWATEALDISIAGSGSVEYYGSPSVTQAVTGVGQVVDRGDR